MKKISLLFVLAYCIQLFGADTLSLNDAVKQKKITITINGINPLSNNVPIYYGASLKAKITNISKKAFVLQIQTGQMLKSNNEKDVQDMVVTKTNTLALPIQKEIKTTLYAMCANKPKPAPTASITYMPNGMCNANLQNVVNEIEKSNHHSLLGQNAVWCITDNIGIENLTESCSDKKKCGNLVSSVCKARNMVTPKAFANAKVTQRINFNYTLVDSSKVKILIYDTNGNFKLSFLESTLKPKGTYQESYWISDADLQAGEYKAMLFINGENLATEDIKI